ncbi:MAG TPA: protein translocase subunit SecF, partial [Epulopiscium sp.]|nr:protein translocase subunit SecF [Candidatus Epulonipiscium sp.]
MDFIEIRKKVFSISIVVIILGLLAMPLNAALGNGILNYDIEFQGGTLMQVNIGKAFDINEDIKPMVIETTGDATPQITKVTGKDEVVIKLTETTPEQRIALFDALKEKYDLDDTEQLNVRDVSPTISGEMKAKAVQAMVIASILMLIYITIRFKNGYMGASAVIALIHDVLVVLMIYTVFRIPINNSFIIVMLTLLGYSINDTIVIFDRIRENKGRVRMNDKDV